MSRAGSERTPMTGTRAAFIAAVALGAALAGFGARGQDPSRPVSPLLAHDAALRELAGAARRAVVSVVARRKLVDAGFRTRKVSLSGTIWEGRPATGPSGKEGADATCTIVTFGRDLVTSGLITVAPVDDGEPVAARLIGHDAETDIALLSAPLAGRVKAPAATEGDAPVPAPGSVLVAAGNPFGLKGSIQFGHVGGVDRTMNLGSVTYDSAIQVDMAVNPGDPGGPVLDARGRLVAILASTLRGNVGGREDDPVERMQRAVSSLRAQGLGFAIPRAVIAAAVQRIRASAGRPRVWLGVEVVPVPDGERKRRGLDKERGVLLSGVVEQSPAQAGGLKTGDILLRWGEAAVEDIYHLQRLVQGAGPDDKVKVVVWREGARKTLTVTLRAR